MSKENTPMQELIDKYEKEVKTTKSPSIEYLLEMVLEDIKDMKLLEKEKQMVVDAHYDSEVAIANIFLNGLKEDELEEARETAEQYYNEKYGE
jgi:UTP-glucose-1-phosphate uridylyltransferase